MTINEEKQQIIEDILGEYEVRSGEILFYCPKCSHKKKKLSFNFKKDKFQCWVCEYSGKSIRNFVKKYGTYDQLKAYSSIDSSVTLDSVYQSIFGQKEKISHVAVCQLPPEYEFIYFASGRFARDALEYLTVTRGLSEKDIYKGKIGICRTGDYANRIIIPSFNSAGNCNYFVARGVYDDTKYTYLYPKIEKSHIIFNEININWNEPIFLTEGCFDAAKIGNNTIPLIGKTIPIDAEFYSRLIEKLLMYRPKIYLCFDTDTVKGQKVNRSIENAKFLMSYGLEDIEILDPYVVGKKDFGELDDIEKKIVMNTPQIMKSKFDLLEKQINMIEVHL